MIKVGPVKACVIWQGSIQVLPLATQPYDIIVQHVSKKCFEGVEGCICHTSTEGTVDIHSSEEGARRGFSYHNCNSHLLNFFPSGCFTG